MRRVAIAALIAVVSTTAHAQTFSIKQPEVTRGAVDLGVETMFARGIPDGGNRFAGEPSIAYGLTDWWVISSGLKFEDPLGADARMFAMSVGNIFVLKAIDDKRAYDTGLGWFTEVAVSTHRDSTNAVLFGFIPKVKLDKLSITANPFLEKTFGRNREEGIALAYGWQVKYDVREGLAFGIEGYGVVDDLGNSPPVSQQEHRLGPVLYTEIPIRPDFKIAAEAGVLFGLTPGTPDAALKVNIGIPLYKPPGQPD